MADRPNLNDFLTTIKNIYMHINYSNVLYGVYYYLSSDTQNLPRRGYLDKESLTCNVSRSQLLRISSPQKSHIFRGDDQLLMLHTLNKRVLHDHEGVKVSINKTS